MDPYAQLAGVYDEIVVDPCHARWAQYLRELWTYDEAGVRSVLDVCCGTGLMTRELLAMGYRVTGVDASPAMLERARRLLGSGADLRHETLPALTLDGVFDAAVSTLDGLNYLTPADLQASLAAVADRLRPGGWLVFDVHTDATMRFAAANPVIEGEDDGRRFTITNVVDADARTCDSRIDVHGGGGFTEHHLQHFFTDAQIGTALADAGFTLVAVTDEYTPAPATDETMRATWIARRCPPN